MKIVYCTDSICYLGGIQNITITKANGLAQIGHQVWIIVTDNKYSPLHPIDPKVQVINLDINYFEDDWKSKFYVIKSILIKRKQHKKAISKLLNEIKPNVVISTGTSEKNFLAKIQIESKPVFIREIHSLKNYRLAHARTFIDKITAIFGDWYDYSWNIKNYDQIVVLTNEDKEINWKNNNKVCVIGNPITIPIESSTLTSYKFITAGRLVYIKNHQSLINAWKIVNQKHPDWQLEIWGDGPLKNKLLEQINNLGLDHKVLLKGYTNDIISQMLRASGCILSSLYEGISLVLIEAMSCGLPLISYACPCGPKELIDHGKNGFLCEVNNEIKLAEYICTIIEDNTLRIKMGQASKKKAEEFQLDRILTKWINLFQTLINNKNK